MDSELTKIFVQTNWCRIADDKKDLDVEFEELFEFKSVKDYSNKQLRIEYTFNIIDSIDDIDGDEKRAAEELLIEYIDRGIKDWKEFKEKLQADFPSLKLLFLSQNYSHCERLYNELQRNTDERNELYNERIDREITRDFLSVLQYAKLSVFAMYDFQSSFLCAIDPQEIFDIQPPNSIYSIVVGWHNNIIKGTIFLEDKQANKQLFFHVKYSYND